MTMEVRVCVEIRETNADTAIVRAEQRETVLPANNDASDYTDIEALGQAALERLTTDCYSKAKEQLGHMGALLPGGAA